MRLLPEEIMSIMRRLEWYSRRRMVGTLSGRHSSPDKGFSVEFAEHLEYSPGDDPKNLDWRVMAKIDRQVFCHYIEETNLRAMIAVDVSGSMNYTGNFAASSNGQELSKLEYAKHLAAALAYLFVKQGDAAGLVTFYKTTRGFTCAGADTNVGGVLHHVAERIPKRGLVVLISDLFDDP